MQTILFSLVLAFTTAFVNSANAEVIVDVSLTPAGDFKAKTDDISGEAVMEGDTVRAENVVVKLMNLKTGIALRDKHAKEKYLEVGKFPDAVLVKAIGQGGKGKGRLKIRGIEKDVEGLYVISGSQLNAEFPIKLSDFGINGIKYMGLGVDDQVKLHIGLPLKKK